MFFKKKKPKLDAKVRFQHKQFTTKLGSARSYRRSAVPVPDSEVQKWLVKIGLGSRWMQILVGFVILTAMYLVYLPNFLTLKQINITGLSETQTHDLESNIRDQIANSKFYSAQNNLFLFNTNLVKFAALKLNSVDSIKSIKKNYKTHSLDIVAQSKYDKYLVATPDKVFDIYNDGTFKSEAGISIDVWPTIENPNMIKVQLYQNANTQNGQQFFDSSLLGSLNILNEQIRTMTSFKFAYFSFKDPKPEAVFVPQTIDVPAPLPSKATQADTPATTTLPVTEQPQPEPVQPVEQQELKLPFSSSEVNAVFYKGTDNKRFFRVIFDTTRDSQKAVDDLKLLLAQTTPDRFNQLDYIDMRLDGKAFICLLNAPCAK